jgi:hypothetical protein
LQTIELTYIARSWNKKNVESKHFIWSSTYHALAILMWKPKLWTSWSCRSYKSFDWLTNSETQQRWLTTIDTYESTCSPIKMYLRNEKATFKPLPTLRMKVLSYIYSSPAQVFFLKKYTNLSWQYESRDKGPVHLLAVTSDTYNSENQINSMKKNQAWKYGIITVAPTNHPEDEVTCFPNKRKQQNPKTIRCYVKLEAHKLLKTNVMQALIYHQ